MKRIICLLAAVLALTASAQDIDSLETTLYQQYDDGQYRQVIETGKMLLSLMSEDYDIYGNIKNIIALSYYYTEDYTKAVEYGTRVVKMRKQILGEEHSDYALSLYNLADYYSKLGEYTKAIQIGTQAMGIRKRVLGEQHPDYLLSLNNLANYYYYLGDYTNAIQMGTLAMEIRRRMLGEEHPDYALSLNNLASCYSAQGNYAKAVELCTQATDIYRRFLGEDHFNYSVSLNNLSKFYSKLGNYEKSMELCTQAMDICKRNVGEEHPDYARSLNNLSIVYFNLGNYAKAIELCAQAMEIYKRTIGEKHPWFAALLCNMACSYSELGNYSKAIELCTQAVEISQRSIGENRPKYAIYLNNLAVCHTNNGDYNKAIELETQVVEIQKRTIGEDHPYLAQSLKMLSQIYFLLGNYQNATNLLYSALTISQNHLFKNLSELPSKERAVLWNEKSLAFQRTYPRMVLQNPEDRLVGDLYDKSCLFAKGLLLAAETDMRQLILESGDEEVVAKFGELQTTRWWLNKLYGVPIAERRVNTDSLENVAERLEGELVKMSKAYGDFMGNMKLTWRDVQKKLVVKDIAVEFLAFPAWKTDSLQYIALTVKKGYDAPRLTKLFSEKELDAIETSFYTDKELSQLVWGRLAGELEGVERIYFSPSGELYNIAIESMPHWADDCMMSDKFNLYRLSSTRELAIARDETPSVGASVYGDIKYDTDVALMGIPRSETGSLHAFRGMNPASCATLRNKYWEELKGTKEEADTIADILSKSKVQVRELTGAGATETTVKNLSGQKRRILHIATHGFYWDEADAEYYRERDRLSFLLLSDTRSRLVEDRALTRSGLLFAGAQNTFYGTEIPAGVDDGVLTAQEIAQLDLRGLDLLVLSACQTGLGDVKGDGVFGLQRGFKKAGARTILMSLREVDDAATRDMMIQFYNAYVTGGRSKRDAFLAAQQYLKEHDVDYFYGSSTERAYLPHWAAFILLDPM